MLEWMSKLRNTMMYLLHLPQIPFMITRQMKLDLLTIGYSLKDINSLTPLDAHTILQDHQSAESSSQPVDLLDDEPDITKSATREPNIAKSASREPNITNPAIRELDIKVADEPISIMLQKKNTDITENIKSETIEELQGQNMNISKVRLKMLLSIEAIDKATVAVEIALNEARKVT